MVLSMAKVMQIKGKFKLPTHISVPRKYLEKLAILTNTIFTMNISENINSKIILNDGILPILFC